MSLWVAVHGLTDGQAVNADTYNKPLFELAERTNYLFSRLQELAGASLFESVRLYDVALTESGVLAPAVKDIVCFDTATGTYVKAQASMSLLDAFVAATSTYALGVLVSKTGATGTVLISGRLTLATDDVPWQVADLLESGEVFRNGTYYLSSVEAGKMTAYPSGPMIYIGSFLCDPNTPTNGDYAVINPQYRDTGEAHVHRAYKLAAQPVGRQVITEEDPTGVHIVIGFPTVLAAEPGEVVPRLACTGQWTNTESVQYTIWLATAAGTDRVTSLPPTDFSDAYIHWVSSDLNEGQGKVRVWSYECEIAIGSRGLKVALENSSADRPVDAVNWDVLYSAVAYGDSPDKRTWMVMAPDQTVGWKPNCKRGYLDGHPASDLHFSMITMDGPHVQSDKRLSDTITVRCAEIHQFDCVQPIATDTTVVGSWVFEYTDDGTVTDPSYLPVMIGDDALATYGNLVTAILALDLDTITPVLDELESVMLIGTPASTTVVHLGVTVAPSAAGTGVLTVGGGSAAFLVYDQYNRNLVANLGALFWDNAEYWQKIQLVSGLQILIIPYGSDGTPKTGDSVEIDDYWVYELTDTAPGANFIYAVGMHLSLNNYYPPVPAKASALMLNGVEMNNGTLDQDTPVYEPAPDSLYWYQNQYGTVPWPLDWTDGTPGEARLAQVLIYHFAKNTIGTTGYVSSVRPAVGSPIKVLRCGTADSATVGDLALDLDLNLGTEDANLPGFQVVKSATGQKLRRGPVVERIVNGPGIIVTQNSGAPQGQGIVTVSLDTGANLYQGDFEEIGLENAKEELIGMFPYIRLLPWVSTSASNTPTGFVAKFRVPHTLPDKVYRVVVYATVFGQDNIATGPDPVALNAGLTFNYSILPDIFKIGAVPAEWANSSLVDNLLEPDTPLSVQIPFGNPATSPVYTSYSPMLIHNYPDEPDGSVAGKKWQALGSPFPSTETLPDWSDPSTLGVRPGTLVAIRISRANVADPTTEYTGSIGFINLRWMLITLD